MIIQALKQARRVLLSACAAALMGIAALTAIAHSSAPLEIAAGPVLITAGGDDGGFHAALQDTYSYHLIVPLPGNSRLRLQ